MISPKEETQSTEPERKSLFSEAETKQNTKIFTNINEAENLYKTQINNLNESEAQLVVLNTPPGFELLDSELPTEPDLEAILGTCDWIQKVKAFPQNIEKKEAIEYIKIIRWLYNEEEAKQILFDLFEVQGKHPRDTVKFWIKTAYKAKGWRVPSRTLLRSSFGHDLISCKACSVPKWISPVLATFNQFIEQRVKGFWLDDKKKNPDVASLAAYYHSLTDYVYFPDHKSFYIYKDGIWVITDRAYVEGFCHDTMKPKPTKAHHVSEFINYAQREHLAPPGFFSTTIENKICLKNGVLDTETMELLPHSKDYGFRSQVPYDYDDEAQCPRWEQFLAEVTCGDQKMADCIMEFFGYALGDHICQAEKAMIFDGGGSNGKSTTIKTAVKLFGKENVGQLSLSSLNDANSRALIENAYINLGEETNVKALADSEDFKSMVTGGAMEIWYKHRNKYQVNNRTKLLFACNDMPRAHDKSDGLYRRLLIVPFNATFSAEAGNLDNEIQIKLEKELPGILNMAIAAFIRLKGNGFKFTESEDMNEHLESYRMDNDNVYKWFKDQCEIDINAPMKSVGSIYEHYRKYIIEDSGTPWPQKAMLHRLKKLVPQDKKLLRKKVDGKLTSFYKNIGYKGILEYA